MRKTKDHLSLFLCFISVTLISASLSAAITLNHANRTRFESIEDLCQAILERAPEAEQTVFAALKEYTSGSSEFSSENLLLSYGYRPSDFVGTSRESNLLPVFTALLGILLFLIILYLSHRRNLVYIERLTAYLERINGGDTGTLIVTEENDFSGLQDAIYKTVTALYQTREEALSARDTYADNLSNIAHQLKTPITSISLSTQMMKRQPSPEYAEQINRQLTRLTHLEEDLLLLSRIDAGTLPLERKAVDIFTALTLAADSLEELLSQADVTVQIPEAKETTILGDMTWTMEAFSNLLKNCMEHTPQGGTVHCTYEQDPLYAEIRIWDEGEGFAKEDLPHLFERFYRGKQEKGDGIGIGLSLAKTIIEMQNGTIRAGNLPEGGAFFEIHFYRH
ncbi:MAG: HAMP domain-containing histidine kinase [Acetatifactor sp.]|nr:HAMP domain-containing histidine kinase [Acetatifactor sp.]